LRVSIPQWRLVNRRRERERENFFYLSLSVGALFTLSELLVLSVYYQEKYMNITMTPIMASYDAADDHLEPQ